MVDNNEIKEFVENVISKAFDKVQKAYDNHREYDVKKNNESVSYEDNSIVFPMYGEHITDEKRKTRISEQELRFAFVEAFKKLNEDNKYYFSVETPTEGRYKFPKGEMPEIVDDGGQSGNFDLVIHDESLRRICFIEFKAKYPNDRSFQKDFLKLANKKEDKDKTDVLRYFIHMVTEYNKSKIKGILQAATDVLNHAIASKREVEPVSYILYSLNAHDKQNDNTEIAKDFSSNGEIDASADIKGISLHWYDEQTKDIKS